MSQQVRRATADRLLATVLDVADGARVDATEAKAIVAELAARGWTKAAIGRRIHGPHAVSLQLSDRTVQAGTLRTLRTLLAEPVPPRFHRHRMDGYVPDTGHRWRHIEPSTPGVPSVEAPLPDGNRLLICAVCARPLADHRITDRCAA